ncbi:MAG: hypothetical protein ACO3C1_13165 [Ilumatobacteraceae bacterium]
MALPTSPSRRRAGRSFTALAAGLAGLALTSCGSSDAGGIGSLDSSFGDKGTVDRSLGDGDDATSDMIVTSDGSIVVVGTTTSSDSGTTSSNMLVERFSADGTVDTAFGVGSDDGSPDGTVTLSLGDGNDEARGLAAQADGKILIVGTSTSTDGTSNIIVARLTADGTPDAEFGTSDDGTPDGFVNVSLSDGDDTADAIAVQADGKILIAGTASSADGNNIAVARMTADGALDSTFGAGTDDGSPDGVVTLSLGSGDDEANAIAVQADGSIVIAGTSSSTDSTGTSTNIIVARMVADGTLDASFGVGTDDGSPDGVVSVSLSDGDDRADALAIQGDGKIVIAGTQSGSDGSNAAIARMNDDGTLDTSFGASADDGTPEGVVGLTLGSGDDSLASIVVQSDGKIVAVGTTTSTGDTSNVFVIRLQADGTADDEFGTADDGTPNGVVNLSFSDGNDSGQAVALQSDGKIVVAGNAVGDSSDFALARLLVS